MIGKPLDISVKEFEGVKAEAILLGFGHSDDATAWPPFRWIVIINDVPFDYRMGQGHCTMFQYLDKSGGIHSFKKNKKPERPTVTLSDFKNPKARTLWEEEHVGAWVHAPKLVEILDSLMMDGEACSMSFREWCDNFGYSSDSIAALKTYDACQQGGDKLRKALGKDYAAVKEAIEAMRERGEL